MMYKYFKGSYTLKQVDGKQNNPTILSQAL
jgi:hypothetical protein